MTRTHLVVAVAPATLAGSATAARAAERMNDRMVKQVIENIDHPEVTTLLRRASDVERRNRANGSASQGA